MKIAINTRFLLPKMEGFGWYTYEIVSRLVKNHPEHEFFLFFDRPFDEKFNFGKNATNIVVYPPARHPILFNIWFNYRVPRLLKKHKVDVFFSPDGYASLRTDVPQIITIHDINFEHYPEDLPKKHLNYFRKNFPKFARKAQHILTVSEYSKQDISTKYQIDKSKITAVWNGASPQFQSISRGKQQKIREKYTDGNEFLLFVGSIHPRKNLQRLLEAYEIYLCQNPSAKEDFLIVGEEMWSSKSLEIKVSSATKKRIHFTGHIPLEVLTKITASAKLMCYVPYFEGFGIPLLEAMQAGTPVLSGNKTSLPEVGGDAPVYCNPFDVKDIVQKLTKTIQNDKKLAEMSQKGQKRSENFSWDTSAETIWQVLCKTYKKEV